VVGVGISLTDGQVAFPAETLTFRVDVEIAGAAHPLLENGAQSFLVRNPTAVLRVVGGTAAIDRQAEDTGQIVEQALAALEVDVDALAWRTRPLTGWQTRRLHGAPASPATA
jgi:hypothetical protein